jgi:hypothetical protein
LIDIKAKYSTKYGTLSMSNKSVFMGSAEQMKDKLGPALCLAKWKQVSLHLPTGLNNSCYHPPLHAIDPVEIQFNPGATQYCTQKSTAPVDVEQ